MLVQDDGTTAQRTWLDCGDGRFNGVEGNKCMRVVMRNHAKARQDDGFVVAIDCQRFLMKFPGSVVPHCTFCLKLNPFKTIMETLSGAVARILWILSEVAFFSLAVVRSYRGRKQAGCTDLTQSVCF